MVLGRKRSPGRSPGPAWLGIGAQRCGTTWFTELLTQHPAVTLGTTGRKEMHALYLPLVQAWGDEQLEAYRQVFPADTLAGEFTPFYLRAPWAASVAHAACRPDAPVLVLVRDPVVRFESAMRLAISQGRFDTSGDSTESKIWVRYVSGDAIWAGMYARQLATWRRVFGRRRLCVIQYERMRAAPQATLDAVWRRLGQDPVELSDVDRPSHMDRRDVAWSVDDVAGLREELVRIYRPDVRRMRRWGVDVRLWPYFARR